MTKKKINIRKIMLQNKRILASLMVVMILFFVLAFDMGVFASNQSESQEGGAFEFDGTVVSHYNLTEPYHVLNWQEMRGNDTQFDSSTYHSCFVWKYTGDNYFSSSQLNPSDYYGSLVPVSVTVNGTTKNISSGGYYLSAVSTGTFRYIHNYRFYSPGKIAIATNRSNYPVVVSDQPFEYIWTRSDTDGSVPVVGYSVIDTVSASGLYIAWLEYTPVNIVFTDMPIYCASLDGSSGYTQVSESAGNNDFSFASENLFDFNNMVKDGVIPDPSAPIEEDSVISQAGLNYNFGYANVQFQQGSDNSTILARWNLNINEYMRLHPYDFAFCSKYTIKLKTASGTKEFSTSFEPTINDVLLHGDQNYLCNMNFNNMNDGNQSLQLYLKELFGQSANVSLYTDGSVISYGVTNPNAGTRSFGGFTLGVKQYFDNIILGATFEYDGYFKFLGDPITESGHVIGTYNLKTGETKVTKDDITTNFNPPENNVNGLSNYTGSSGMQYGSGSAIATIQSGAVQIMQSGGFQISNQDWNEYGNLVETMNRDMMSIVSDNGVSGFFGAVKNAYTVFPDKIWALIGIGIGGSVAIGLWKKGTHCH